MIKTYEELVSLDTFEERFDYLKLNGRVGDETLGSLRYLCQKLYLSPEWKLFRNKVIIRDDSCDLACPDRPIFDEIFIHHLNPITKEDLLNRSPILFDLNNVICMSFRTHNALHYGNKNLLILDPIIRTKNDTCPWKK